MIEIVDDVSDWLAKGSQDIVVATVLKTWGSAPRRPGAKLAIDGDKNMSGSISGGCVEGAVIESARDTLENGAAQLLHFGVADETAWGVGLACGGSIDIFVETLDLPAFDLARRIIREEHSGATATIVRGTDELVGQHVVVDRQTDEVFSTMAPDLQTRVLDAAAAIGETQIISLDENTQVFVDLIRPLPTLVAVGGGEIAIALTKMAQLSDYRTVVIDPRRAFSTQARFPHVHQVIQKWPRSAFAEIDLSPDTAVALLTHDPKIDDPSLKILLNEDVAYIGALGSRKTHAQRVKRLREMGFSNSHIERIHAPIGLDIGAATPQEIAVSIMAEIIGVRRGRPAVEPA